MYDTRTLREGEHSDFMRTLLQNMKIGQIMSYPIYDVRGITCVDEVVCNMEKAFELPGGVYNFGSPNDRSTYETVYEVFTRLGLDVSRLQKNEDAFRDNPRNISMSQDKINKYGIRFSTTENGLMQELRIN